MIPRSYRQAFRCNHEDLVTIVNSQDGVPGLLDCNKDEVVRYTCDAWGKVLSTTDSFASTLGTVQPFRYRRYVYDVETGLYYLRSRYYNPTWNRFMNADALIKGNLFDYCNNHPIALTDHNGASPESPYVELSTLGFNLDYDSVNQFVSGLVKTFLDHVTGNPKYEFEYADVYEMTICEEASENLSRLWYGDGNGSKYDYNGNMHWGKIEMDDQYSIPICYNSSGTFPARPQYGITPGIYQVTIAVYSTVLDHYENGVAKTKNYIALLNISNKDTTNSDYLTNGMWYRRHMGRSDDDYSRLLRYLTGHE